MQKLHTRQRRKTRMTGLGGRKRARRPKTFKTAEAAKKYAEEKGIKTYKLVDLHAAKQSSNKFRIVE